ncbi:MAG: hypothetical protein V1681_01295 [Candidatus Neomarinimicrobiota bacterium]
MIRKLFLFSIGLLLICQFAIILNAQNNNWARETAVLTTPGRIEKGLFEPLYYGLSDQFELSSYVLADVLIPNLSLKWAHPMSNSFTLVSVHSFNFPTPLLRVLARKGIGGIISPEFSIPPMIGLYNGVILSKSMPANQIISLKAGIDLGLKGGKLDDRTTIDLPLVYPRLMPFYHGYGVRMGADYRKQIGPKMSLLLDYDVFMFPGANDGFAFENKALLFWHPSDRTQFSIGYKLVYGQYPFGSQWHLLCPVFDIQRAWQIKK